MIMKSNNLMQLIGVNWIKEFVKIKKKTFKNL